MIMPSRHSILARGFALAAFALTSLLASAQQQEAVFDPPARAATVSAFEGSVVFAPAGQTDWADLPRNRPLTRGDRLWTDDGAHAEVHFGSSVLHMDSRTFVEVIALDDDVLQLSVNEGSVNARARELRAGDNFEIDTPQLALRASQPGDWRIDVDPQRGLTRVTSHGGAAVLYGAGGGVQQVMPGEQRLFTGADLAPVPNPSGATADAFDRWAQDRNRLEDQSQAARYVPRDVVGYSELDRSGTWAQDAAFGPVWYPRVAAADWAPYRYGHWESIAPWGWTWVDDAPWGFAPFHYGRWTVIGTRWAWVPGPMGRHPVYAPALVAFVSGTGAAFASATGPGIGWYPLAPGEVWQPFFAASPVYVRNVNRYVVADSRHYNTGAHFFLSQPGAITTVRVDDFHRGRPVQSRWTRVHPADLSRVQPMAPPAPLREARRDVIREQPRMPPQPAQAQRVDPRVVQQQAVPQRPAPQQHWRGGEEGGYTRQ